MELTLPQTGAIAICTVTAAAGRRRPATLVGGHAGTGIAEGRIEYWDRRIGDAAVRQMKENREPAW